MKFSYFDSNRTIQTVNAEINRIVIYGNGCKLFDRELPLDTFTIEQPDNGEHKLHSVYHGAPVEITLNTEVKTARKENLNRKDNYTLTYTPEYLHWERRTALYIHISEIEVTDLGNMLAMETKEEKNYIHAFVLHFNGPVTFDRLHADFIQCDDYLVEDFAEEGLSITYDSSMFKTLSSLWDLEYDNFYNSSE